MGGAVLETGVERISDVSTTLVYLLGCPCAWKGGEGFVYIIPGPSQWPCEKYAVFIPIAWMRKLRPGEADVPGAELKAGALDPLCSPLCTGRCGHCRGSCSLRGLSAAPACHILAAGRPGVAQEGARGRICHRSLATWLEAPGEGVQPC